MSVDEDTELRDLVTQTLEANGVLGNIRARLRASVFLALEEQDSVKNKSPMLNEKLKTFLSTNEGQLAISLVREFLEFFKLEYTLAVFDPESGFSGQFETRSSLTNLLNISDPLPTSKVPLIAEVIKRVQLKASTSTQNLVGGQHVNSANGFGESNNGDIKARLDEAKVKVEVTANEKNVTTFHSDRTSKDSFSSHDDVSDESSLFGGKKIQNDKRTEKNDSNEMTNASKPDDKHEVKDSTGKPVNSGMSSLAGLPSIVPFAATDKKTEENKKQSKDNDNDVSDYDEDFQLSNASPVIQTPRSDKNEEETKEEENDDEEVDEDIEEDIKTDESSNDELLTTDKTVSIAEQSAVGDYFEDVLHP